VDDDDYGRYVALLATVVLRQGWRLFSYCLMPNHVHLLIKTPEPNLANGMQWLQSRYALAFNERHHRTGHLFEAPYKSPLITSDERFVTTLGYIVVNPVEAVLCRRASDWAWGSHALITSRRRLPDWLDHHGVLDILEGITGARCYTQLVNTRERALLTQPSRSALSV